MMRLPDGLIFEIARDAGLPVPEKGSKRQVRCPFHEDRNPSAFLSSHNVFFCSVCTPNAGWTAKQFAEALKLDWKRYLERLTDRPPAVALRWAGQPEPPFDSDDALVAWSAAFARARDDDAVDAERDVYRYLASRGLGESWELGCFGILSPVQGLHPAIADWPTRSYRIAAPLYDLQGRLANIQARSIQTRTPKTLNPRSSTVRGTVFADPRGRSLLRGEAESEDRVLLGEGLSDMLALSIASPVPVLAAPGTSSAVAAVGKWARGRDILLALDCDATGNAAVKPVSLALYQHGARRVRRIYWPMPAKDACDVVARSGITALEAFLNELLVEVAA